MRDFKGIELFAVGTWNGRKFTHADLDAIVDAYKASKDNFNIPIRLGHSDKTKLLLGDAEPAAGWVENIKRVGNKLVGDFMRVPDKVADWIDSGAYRKRSVELNREFKIGDTKHSLVMTGLALLGGTLPAVDGLADIAKLYEREQLEAEDESELYLFAEEEEEESIDDLLAAIDAITTRAERFFKGRPGAPIYRNLHRAFKQGVANAAKARNHSREEDMEKETEIRAVLGITEEEDILEAVKAVKGPPATKEPDTELAEELARAQERLLVLEGNASRQRAETLVDGHIRDLRLLPVQRETAIKMALRNMDDFNAFVETQPKGLVELQERGTETSPETFAQFEPTDADIKMAKELGVWSPEHRIALMRQKAAARGIEIPADYGKEKAKA